ncbi:hypothetical protein GCM10023063_19480 [Arthrobacter methylotrophus]|uniref:DUF1918 domain-containing protein n=1 Tax=Arthrobacter methylotrophus TaxID=121291 RepID=A0ABV5URS8_9MICC
MTDDLKASSVNTDEMNVLRTGGSALRRGQQVWVRVGAEDLGTGKVDDMTDDGSMVWVVFGGATPRRMFIPEDQAEFTVLPLDS